MDIQNGANETKGNKQKGEMLGASLKGPLGHFSALLVAFDASLTLLLHTHNSNAHSVHPLVLAPIDIEVEVKK